MEYTNHYAWLLSFCFWFSSLLFFSIPCERIMSDCSPFSQCFSYPLFNFYSLSHVNSVTFTLSFYLSSIFSSFVQISFPNAYWTLKHIPKITRITREKEVWAQITNHQLRHHIFFFFCISSLLSLFVTLLLHPLSLFSLCSVSSTLSIYGVIKCFTYFDYTSYSLFWFSSFPSLFASFTRWFFLLPSHFAVSL